MDGYLLFCVGVVNESTEAKDFVAYAPPILGPRWMQGNGFWVLASNDDVDVSYGHAGFCELKDKLQWNPCFHGTAVSCGRGNPDLGMIAVASMPLPN
jgi:hypothetical protein